MALGFQIGRRELWTCALIVLLALGLRLFYLSELSASPLFSVPVVDARTYVDDARYLSEVSWAGKPTPFWQPPLYPYLLGLLFSRKRRKLLPAPSAPSPIWCAHLRVYLFARPPSLSLGRGARRGSGRCLLWPADLLRR